MGPNQSDALFQPMETKRQSVATGTQSVNTDIMMSVKKSKELNSKKLQNMWKIREQSLRQSKNTDDVKMNNDMELGELTESTIIPTNSKTFLGKKIIISSYDNQEE